MNIAVHRNLAQEKRQRAQFWDLQDKILSTFGVELPKPPKLEVSNYDTVRYWKPFIDCLASVDSQRHSDLDYLAVAAARARYR